MDFWLSLKAVYSINGISVFTAEPVVIIHTFPIPLLPRVAEGLVLSLLLDDDPAGEP